MRGICSIGVSSNSSANITWRSLEGGVNVASCRNAVYRVIGNAPTPNARDLKFPNVPVSNRNVIITTAGAPTSAYIRFRKPDDNY